MEDVKQTEIFRVLSGSRAHGLEREDSDWDYRSVFYVSTPTLLVIPANMRPHWGQEVEEHAGNGWEVEQALMMASTGHPNALELIYWEPEPMGSDKAYFEAHDLRRVLSGLVQPQAVLDSAVGYTKNCLTKLLAERQPERAAKWKTTYLRTLWASCKLLETGEYPARVPEESRIRAAPDMTIGMVLDLGREWEDNARKLSLPPRTRVDWTEANQWLAEFRKKNFDN